MLIEAEGTMIRYCFTNENVIYVGAILACLTFVSVQLSIAMFHAVDDAELSLFAINERSAWEYLYESNAAARKWCYEGGWNEPPILF